MKPVLVAGLLLSLFTSPGEPQGRNEYRASAERQSWVSDNPFRLFLLRGGDTIGNPIRGISIFHESWRPASDGFQVVRASADIGLGAQSRTDTMSVDPYGKVLRINGRTDYNEGEWDALLRLPAAPLTVGLEWSDTIRHPTDGPHGQGRYEVRRTYRVAREVPSPDGPQLEIEINGEIDFSLSMWMDSTAGQYRWFDLKGPVRETFQFDPATGQLHARSWTMLLQGTGGDFDGTASDTVPAGLRSENRRYRIPYARAEALMSSLPGQDSSITVRSDGTPLFVHTLGREPEGVVEGFRRADGLIGRADVKTDNGKPTRWTFTWVDLESDARSVAFEIREAGLFMQDRKLELPPGAWGIAEYGMAGTLLPSLPTTGDSEPVPLAIYRPTAQKWDQLTVSSRRLDEFTLFVLNDESGAQTALIVDSDGMLMFEERSTQTGERSVRVPTSVDRQSKLQQAITALRGGI